nr:unnamed protein product [Callosobruchus analis]
MEIIEKKWVEIQSHESQSSSYDEDNSKKDDNYVDKTTTWYKKPIVSRFSMVKKKNIVKLFPGPKPSARNITDKIQAFEKMFTGDILGHIVECTKLEIHLRPIYERRRDTKDTTKVELLPFLYLLYLLGDKKQNHTHFLELWAIDGTGNKIFWACMGCNRFLFLIRATRFHTKTTGGEREATDKLAAADLFWIAVKKRCMILLSTVHDGAFIDPETNKPFIILTTMPTREAWLP